MKLKRIGLIILLLTQIIVFADGQPNCRTRSGKAERLYNKAIDLLVTGQKEERKEAYKLLIDATKIDKSYADANFALGDINYQKSKVQIDAKRKLQLENRAIKYFNRVLENCPKAHDAEVYYYIGEIYFQRNDFKSAEKHLLDYINNCTKQYFQKETASMLERIKVYFELINHPVEFKPVKIAGINTKEDEFLPVISPDGEVAIYTHRQNRIDKETQRGTVIDELTISHRTNSIQDLNEIFSVGQKMPSPFNQNGLDQGAMSMTIDNRELYITICKFEKGAHGPFKNCDIYVSYNENGEWSSLKNLGPNINGKFSWESQPSISADGKTLYFSSIRPSNIGFDYKYNQTADIYYSEKDKNGQWSKAKNIGAPINTKGNEKSPFMHTDSKTLYFSSDGLPGLGGYDIFYAKENKDGWEAPINIGYPINKEANDIGFFVSTNGKKAYFSSDELDNSKRWNIYSFNLYKKARPGKVFFAKGKLLDDKGHALADATVEIQTSSSKKPVEGMVNKKTGEYAIAIAVEEDDEVLLTVKKKGHAFSSKYIKPTEDIVEKPAKINMEVKKVKVGTRVQINDIHFASNSSMFMHGSLFILDNFVKYLQENPNIKIEIHGHTDSAGGSRANKRLSEQRAKIVRDYLVFQGVNPNRIVAYKGFGESKPIASNRTPEGRSKNRRTEFLIVAD